MSIFQTIDFLARLDMRYKLGDKIDYGFYKNLEIIAIDTKHYTLKNKNGGTKKVYIELVDKHAVLLPREKKEKVKRDKKKPWDERGWHPDPEQDRRNIVG